MILRKPYAFIIKHFRLIHLIILGCLIFININIINISNLSKTLLTSQTYTFAGTDVYINKQIYLFIFIALALSGIVYWLLHKKKKPTGLYLGLLIYLVLLIVSFIYLFSVLLKMQNDSLTNDTLSFIRDLTVMIRIPNYVFIIICLLRGIGFNIKQFNFSKDIAELKIAEKDSEEYELMLGKNNYKYMRFIRRTIREIKYYILENRLAMTFIIISISGVLIFFGFKYYNDNLKTSKPTDTITFNNISYKILYSYITKKNYKGNIVKEGSKFVVLDMIFKNTGNKELSLNPNILSISHKELFYLPTFVYTDSFYDLGTPYIKEQIINPGEELEATLEFEIPETSTEDDFLFRIQTSLNNKTKNVIPIYKKIKFNAKKIDTDTTNIEYGLNEKFASNVVSRNKIDLEIKGYDIKENYNDKYQLCNKELECYQKSHLITANSTNMKTMLIFDYSLQLTDNPVISKTFITNPQLLSKFLTVKYVVNNKTYYTDAKLVNGSDTVEDKLFIYIDRNIEKASEIILSFTFRNNTFNIKLKTR